MTQAAAAISEIPTVSPQFGPDTAARVPARTARSVRSVRAPKAAGRGRKSRRVVGQDTYGSQRGGEVVELEHGIRVYPPKGKGGRWRSDGEVNCMS